MTALKPYYNAGGITIYHGDALDVLDALTEAGTTIDAAVMDPPYASGARTEAKKPSSGAMVRGARWNAKPIENDQMTTAGFVWLMRMVFRGVARLLPDGGSVACFIDWRQWGNLLGAAESVNLRVNQMVVWDKESYGLGHGFRSQHELILHASKGVPEIHAADTGNVFSHKRDSNEEHPSPKPPQIIERALRVICPPRGRALDPFMGSGSTLVAAKALGMSAIGIELEERYCEVAARRLSQEALPL